MNLVRKKKQGDDQKCSTPYTLLDLDYDAEDVVDRLKELKEIVDYMHDERAYCETKPGEIIPFSLAKEIRPF